MSNAIRDAAEFNMIGNALEETRVEAIAQELKRALKGTSTQDESNRTPYQFQSQFFFGSIFALGGLTLTVAGDHHGFPDFVVDNGTLRHGIEVKRPESRDGLQRALRSGADQLARLTGPGMLALDLTEVLDADPGTLLGSYDEWEAALTQRFYELEAEIDAQIRRDIGKRFRGVSAVAFYSRGGAWAAHEDVGGGAVPVYHMRFGYWPVSTLFEISDGTGGSGSVRRWARDSDSSHPMSRRRSGAGDDRASSNGFTILLRG